MIILGLVLKASDQPLVLERVMQASAHIVTVRDGGSNERSEVGIYAKYFLDNDSDLISASTA